MAEYIEREWLVKEAEALLNFRRQHYMDKARIADAASTVEWLKYYAPAADVEEVIHAHWEAVEREAFWLSDSDIWMKSGKPTIHLMPVCSHCKTEFGTIVLDFKRCPECGAKMDGERRSE